jgi:hypothetical protein
MKLDREGISSASPIALFKQSSGSSYRGNSRKIFSLTGKTNEGASRHSWAGREQLGRAYSHTRQKHLPQGTSFSGQQQRQLRISKEGNPFLRRLLVNCAQCILGPFGQDSQLRRQGLSLCKRGGKNAKKRAVVAAARISGRGSAGDSASPPRIRLR